MTTSNHENSQIDRWLICAFTAWWLLERGIESTPGVGGVTNAQANRDVGGPSLARSASCRTSNCRATWFRAGAVARRAPASAVCAWPEPAIGHKRPKANVCFAGAPCVSSARLTLGGVTGEHVCANRHRCGIDRPSMQAVLRLTVSSSFFGRRFARSTKPLMWHVGLHRCPGSGREVGIDVSFQLRALAHRRCG